MGTAHVQGKLWGARARDYANLAEEAFRPLYETVFDATGVGAETRLLDVGCGPGLAAYLAARRGAQVAGIDAAETSVAIARERTPEGDFRVGDLEELPWPDHSFDVVTGFNSFPFAADLVHALREAKRVARPGGRIAMAVWGRPEDCETPITVAAVNKLLPPPPQVNSIPLYTPGRVEALMREAGLAPIAGHEVECAFLFPDLETAVRGLMSAGVMVAAAQQMGEETVRQVVAASLASFRTEDGGYCQRNRFRYVIAAA
ncbi:MAG TPA: class I SAM-dependent methyltransferase [Caldilineaceae bacterium]|nr:class I SAM-dependent methyltransferase [Caldilineaceae bacterium]